MFFFYLKPFISPILNKKNKKNKKKKKIKKKQKIKNLIKFLKNKI